MYAASRTHGETGEETEGVMLRVGVTAELLNKLLAINGETPAELECNACRRDKFVLYLEPKTPKIIVTCANCEVPMLEMEVVLLP